VSDLVDKYMLWLSPKMRTRLVLILLFIVFIFCKIRYPKQCGPWKEGRDEMLKEVEKFNLTHSKLAKILE